MLERQCCNAVFPQNKCPDAHFKFQQKDGHILFCSPSLKKVQN